MTDKRQLKSKFTMEERIKIAQEFVSSNLSARELNEKYGIRGKNVIPTWRDRYLLGKYYLHKSKKSSTFAGEIKTGIVMNDPERQELEHQIADLERRLQQGQMDVITKLIAKRYSLEEICEIVGISADEYNVAQLNQK